MKQVFGPVQGWGTQIEPSGLPELKKSDQSLGRARRLEFVDTTTEDRDAQNAPEICKGVPSDLRPSTDLGVYERKF